VEAWNSDRAPFHQWVRNVSKSFFGSHLRLEGAARWVKTTPAEMAAVLQLATMDDDALELLSVKVPPKTTWFAFADTGLEGVRAGLEVLQKIPKGVSSYKLVADAITRVAGPGPSDRIAKLPGGVLVQMGNKAEQYGALGKKGFSALKSMGIQKKNGRTLTPRQVAFVHSLLEQLVDAGIVRRNSQDGDQSACDAVLDALAR
jgi:hypothetical protein